MSEPAPSVSIGEIFWAFLVIGATSLGGGVVGYLRSSLVGSLKWLDDETFVELLAICQSMPGLNASNMAILVGDRLRGGAGAAVALIGICLPGGLIMVAAAAALDSGAHDHPLVRAALRGVSAGAVGMVLYVTVQLGLKTIRRPADAVFAAATLLSVSLIHESVLLALITVAPIAALWFQLKRKSGDQQ